MGNGIFRKNCSFFEHFTDDSNFRILAMAETEFNKQTMVRRNSKTEFRASLPGDVEYIALPSSM